MNKQPKPTPQPRGPEGVPVDAPGKRNPSHDTHKSPEDRPRGAGDGELMEQPDSQGEAREPGADTPKFDE